MNEDEFAGLPIAGPAAGSATPLSDVTQPCWGGGTPSCGARTIHPLGLCPEHIEKYRAGE